MVKVYLAAASSYLLYLYRDTGRASSSLRLYAKTYTISPSTSPRYQQWDQKISCDPPRDYRKVIPAAGYRLLVDSAVAVVTSLRR